MKIALSSVVIVPSILLGGGIPLLPAESKRINWMDLEHEGVGMGYYLYIHRADHWCESEDHPISASEWMAVVVNDPELRLDPHHEFQARWFGPCRYPDGTWFAWSASKIFTKNPDRAIVAKMLQLASKLGARVQGDHGEFYNVPEDMLSKDEFANLHNPKRMTLHPYIVVMGCLLISLAMLFVFITGLWTIWRWM